jgi:hypothetical protein
VVDEDDTEDGGGEVDYAELLSGLLENHDPELVRLILELQVVWWRPRSRG